MLICELGTKHRLEYHILGCNNKDTTIQLYRCAISSICSTVIMKLQSNTE